MARTITKTDRKATVQWRVAWALLPREWQRAIARFCMLTDTDVGEAAFRGADEV